MSKTERKRCAKRVYSGQRYDFTGHVCSRYALPDSDFCRIHQPVSQQERQRDTAEAKVAPTMTSRRQVNKYATLSWEPGQGPVVPIPYQLGSGFITQASAKQIDDGRVDFAVVGVVRLKDSTPGNRTWDASWKAAELLNENQKQLLRTELASFQS